MSDIRDKILTKYSIDILKENILKLYKIDSQDASIQDIEAAIEATRKRWNQSINGANEKNAERDRARLENADKYEEIIRNGKLRTELFKFYSSSTDKATKDDVSIVGFAKEYFGLIATTKKIRKSDVEFFFEYFQEERKNKKAVVDMLDKEFKVIGLGKESDYRDEDNEDLEGKKKDDDSLLIVNRFQKATVLKLRKCLFFYESAKACQEICYRFPCINDGLYYFLGIKDVDDIQAFRELISEKAKEAYTIRQEKGAEYIPLVDLFNTLQSLSEYRDVVDNFEEFKIMLRYPALTPYMFGLKNMKPSTLKKLNKIATSEYRFRDETDFLLNYFIPLHDNFGINDSGISIVIKKAKKKTKANKVLNEISEKLGRKTEHKMSFGAKVLYWLVYCPVFLVYFVFEVFKAIFTELHKLAIPVFLIFFFAQNWLFPKLLGVDNLLVLGKILSKSKWYDYLSSYVGAPIDTAFEAIVVSLICIIVLVTLYTVPSILVSGFVIFFAIDLNERYDWIGYERTFQNIFNKLREKNEKQFLENKRKYILDKLKRIVINVICVIVVAIIIYYIPIGCEAFSEATGYFQ